MLIVHEIVAYIAIARWFSSTARGIIGVPQAREKRTGLMSTSAHKSGML